MPLGNFDSGWMDDGMIR